MNSPEDVRIGEHYALGSKDYAARMLWTWMEIGTYTVHAPVYSISHSFECPVQSYDGCRYIQTNFWKLSLRGIEKRCIWMDS